MTGPTYSEGEVLAPRDPNLSNDDWPDYDLHNVHVYHDDDTANLLQASEHHPLKLTGEIQLQHIPKDKYPDVVRLKTPGRVANVVLDDVRLFAYGEFEDGNIAIWAAGQAGWYTLRPARAYRTVHQEMVQAVKMLYFIGDAYRVPRCGRTGKSSREPEPYSPTELFQKYAQDHRCSAEKAEEIIYRHREFLLSSMAAGKESIDWNVNPLFLHLQKIFPDEYEAIRRRMFGPEKGSRKKAGSVKLSARQQIVESGSTTSSLKRKRGRPAKNARAVDVISIASSSVASAVPRMAGRPTALSQQSESTITRRTRQNPQPQIETVSEERPEEAEDESSPDEEDVEKTPLPEISDSDNERRHTAGKGKSALRLKPCKASKGRDSKGKAPIPDGDDEDELAMPSSPLKPVGKRRHASGDDTNRRKRRNSRQELVDDDEGIDIPSSPSSHTAASEADLALRLAHKFDPVQEDTWICALDGCTHKVYLASREESQKLIREHYALHAYDDDDRVQMVKKLGAPSLPVSHLMERVRMTAKLEGFPGSRVAGSRFPAPIVQKL